MSKIRTRFSGLSATQSTVSCYSSPKGLRPPLEIAYIYDLADLEVRRPTHPIWRHPGRIRFIPSFLRPLQTLAWDSAPNPPPLLPHLLAWPSRLPQKNPCEYAGPTQAAQGTLSTSKSLSGSPLQSSSPCVKQCVHRFVSDTVAILMGRRSACHTQQLVSVQLYLLPNLPSLQPLVLQVLFPAPPSSSPCPGTPTRRVLGL